MNEAPVAPMLSVPFRTVSGNVVDLLAPDWKRVEMRDLTLGLARIRRFNGQTRRPISVAEHSRSVAALLPLRLRLAGLLHDGHEYVIGDITTPVARALAALVAEDFALKLGLFKWGWDLAIGRAVLEAFAPASARPDGGLEHEALALAHAMHSPSVRDADREALLAEEQAFAGLPLRGRRAPSAAALKAPDESAMACGLLWEIRGAIAAWLGREP